MADGRITFSTALDNKQLAKDIALTSKQIELVFDAAGKIFEAGAKYFDELVQSNAEYQAQVAKLRGALATAFQPLYEVALPICMTILQVLTDIANVAASVLSGLFGKTAKESADNAKALNKEAAAIKGVGSAAKEAKKSLASFDQINRLGEEQSGGGGGGASAAGVDFSAFDEAEYMAKIRKLEAYISGALLALGAILTFSGANIPLGLALMAMGAAGMAVAVSLNWQETESEVAKAMFAIAEIVSAAVLVLGIILLLSGAGTGIGIALIALGAASMAAATQVNWDSLVQTLQGPIGELVMMVSGLLLEIGIILLFSGGATPLGLGLIAAGAAGLAATVAANWDSIVETMRGPLGELVELVSGGMLALGIILLFSGAATPLGLGLIAAGAAGLATALAFNPDWLLDKVKEVWGAVEAWWDSTVAVIFTAEYWQEKAASIGDGIAAIGKAIGNMLIGMINELIVLINSMGNIHIPAGPFGAWDAMDVQLWKIPDIPMLAQGAVIPPNAPFMAMLGDQRNGTNLEAPEALIRQIVREEAGNNERMEALLEALLEAVRNIRVGDDTIGRAASRYIARTDRALGR